MKKKYRETLVFVVIFMDFWSSTDMASLRAKAIQISHFLYYWSGYNSFILLKTKLKEISLAGFRIIKRAFFHTHKLNVSLSIVQRKTCSLNLETRKDFGFFWKDKVVVFAQINFFKKYTNKYYHQCFGKSKVQKWE